MKIVGIYSMLMTVLGFVFVLFPDSLLEVRKMDTYRLVALCIAVIGSIYWISYLIFFLINRRKPLGSLRNLNGPLQIVTTPPYPHQYFIEGGVYHHIPDEPTFEYLGNFFGFKWGESKVMSPEEFNRKFVPGTQLPSICPKQNIIEKIK